MFLHKKHKSFLFSLVILGWLAGVACAVSGLPVSLPLFAPTETATFTPTATATATFTVTASPTFTLTPTFTVTPSPTATFTPLPTATNTRVPTRPPAPPSPSGSSNFAAQVIALVNNERTSRGLPALSINWTLMANAQAWSEYMAANNVFYHSGQNVAENIAAGYATPGDAVAAWMNSEGHRANILNPSYTQVGAGYAYSANSQYGHYWTLQFLP